MVTARILLGTALLSARLVFGQTSVSASAASASQLSKVPPPTGRVPSPAFYIYQDVDGIAYPNGNTTVCSPLKSIRSHCYILGVKEKSYAVEQECLCTPDSAYQITQNFAQQYNLITNETLAAAYYNEFLLYIYDCYCGVTGTDVTYNQTANPVVPYIPGYTGDCIVPPVGGCPVPETPKNPGPVPPCGCPPPAKPLPAPCQIGYHRVQGVCVQVCPPVPSCVAPQILNGQGQCECPYGLINSGPGECSIPDCGDPNKEYIITPRAGYCECAGGYELPGDDPTAQCQLTCPAGQTRPQPYTPCQTVCQEPELPAWDGSCICPYSYGYTLNEDNQCVLITCPSPSTYDYYYGGCVCTGPAYTDINGDCRTPQCDIYSATCYPDSPDFQNITCVYTSSAPTYSSYMPTTTYNTSLYTATATMAVYTLAPSPLSTPANVTMSSNYSSMINSTGSSGTASKTGTAIIPVVSTATNASVSSTTSTSASGQSGSAATSLSASGTFARATSASPAVVSSTASSMAAPTSSATPVTIPSSISASFTSQASIPPASVEALSSTSSSA